jgi:hypothetical protein
MDNHHHRQGMHGKPLPRNVLPHGAITLRSFWAHAAELGTAKILINSIMSARNGRFMTIDLKDFCLNTVMPNCECVRARFKGMPKELADAMGWAKCIDSKGHICFTVSGGMCGLPQAGKLAADQLEKFLALCGFIPAGCTLGLWKQKTRDILFTLIVDDFGVHCTNRADVGCLILQPPALPAILQNRNDPKQWTCAFVGHATGCNKGNSTLRGARALSTRPTISANTIPRRCLLPNAFTPHAPVLFLPG